MIYPSTHEPCTNIFLNFQIHFWVFLLSFNLTVLFPNNECCTIPIGFSFIYLFSLLWYFIKWHHIFLKSKSIVLQNHYLQRRQSIRAAWLEKFLGREVGGCSGWGTRVHPWQIHVDVWQNQHNIVKRLASN